MELEQWTKKEYIDLLEKALILEEEYTQELRRELVRMRTDHDRMQHTLAWFRSENEALEAQKKYQLR